MKSEYLTWETMSFNPCPAGWRVVYKNEQEPTKPFIYAMAGWLTQKQIRLDNNGNYVDKDEHCGERVIAGALEGSSGEVEAIDDSCNFLGVLAPGQEWEG